MATLRAMPVLQVTDVTASEAFYARLGFVSHGAWGDPPGFAIVQRGDVTLALDRGNGAPPLNQWWAAYVYVDDAAALREEFSGEGIAVTELCEQEYGLRDFDVVDPDGHRIAFGSDIVKGDWVPGLGPDRGKG
ncbi:MAG: VOC family protein [Pseudomonadota bacterium]